MLTALLGLTFAALENDPEFTYTSIFESDSDFMRGFETGVLLRSKSGSPDDFGCHLPADAKSTTDQAA